MKKENYIVMTKKIIHTMRQSVRLNSAEIIRDIFHAFSLNKAPCTANELVEMTDLPKSTLYKYLQNLTNINFLEKTDGNNYFIGSKLAIYSDLYNKYHPALKLLKEGVKQLSKKTGCTVQLCTRLDGMHIVIYENIPDTANSMNTEMLGRKFPITWTASGRLLLDKTTRSSLLRDLQKSDLTLPDNSTLNLDTLIKEIRLARKENFYKLDKDYYDNTCMATRIRLNNEKDYTINIELFSNVDPQFFENTKKELLSLSEKLQKIIFNIY